MIIKLRNKVDKLKLQALELLRKYSNTNQLQADRVLNSIPDDWNICTDNYNLTEYLIKMFDHKLTVEENTRISSHLSNMETLNCEKESIELKQAYMVVSDDSFCKKCDHKLQFKFIKVFPNGEVFHSRCTDKDSNKCPTFLH